MTGYHIAGIILIAASALFVAAAGVFERSSNAKKKAAEAASDTAGTQDPEIEGHVPPRPALFVEVCGERYHLTLNESEAAAAFVSELSRGELTEKLDGTGGRLALGGKKSELPGGIQTFEAKPGDILITEEGFVAVCLTDGTLNGTMIARAAKDGEKLAAALNGKTADVRFFIEWSE